MSDSSAIDPSLVLESKELARLRVIDELIDRGDSDIQQFYNGAVVLVTGGSGFLGKQLIEKLFRSCNISKLYMLMRSKKGKSVQERMKDFLKDPVFDKVRKVKPDFYENIVPVLGDVTEIGLGMSEQDWNNVTNKVSVIFHGAATVSFVEPLKLATITNVRGAREMLALAKRCTQLKAYVHISTAYSHATYSNVKKTVDEKFYDSPVSPTALIELAESTYEDRLNDITPAFIKNWPNTYAFTKAAAEELVRTMGADLPICIVRPAIVISALREPYPGWIEPSCAMGPSGFAIGIGLGALHAIYCEPKNNMDIVAVDLVNNTIIAAAKETSDRRTAGENDIKIYTVTGTRSPISVGEMIHFKNKGPRTEKAIWYNWVIPTNFRPLFLFMHWTLHLFPAIIADAILKLMGKRPKAVKLYGLLSTFSAIYEYYLTNDWQFGDDNLQQLYSNMSQADRTIFECNMKNLDWNVYLMLWCTGMKRFILKDDVTAALAARKKQFWLAIANAIVLPLYYYALFKIIYTTVFVAFTIICKILGIFDLY